MKYVYTVAQIVFIGFAIENLMHGAVWNYDFLILAFLMGILRKLEEMDG